MDQMRLALTKVMPHHQREANKSKFLEPSKAKERLYHATGADIKEFDESKIKRPYFGHGFHLTESPTLANFYADQHKENQNVMPVHAQIKNPFVMKSMTDWYDVPGNTDKERTDWIKSQGYDGIEYPHGAPYNAPHESGKAFVAFHPTQIKSAIGNRGTYDVNEPDITKAQGGEVKYPSIEEMLQKLRESGRTPIVPAPNRWFADAEKHPFQQKMIEKVLAQTGQGREGFPSGSYINPQTGEPMDFEIMHDLGVAIDPSTGRPMMSGIRSDLTEIDPKFGSITKSNLVRKGLFKHEGGDQLLKDLAFLATIEKSGKGHHYGLSTEYASPAELVNTMTGANPTLRPHSRGDIFGVGEEVGRISIQGKHHPVYEKLLVAPTGSHVQGKKLHKAKGGQVTHAHHLEIEERPL